MPKGYTCPLLAAKATYTQVSWPSQGKQSTGPNRVCDRDTTGEIVQKTASMKCPAEGLQISKQLVPSHKHRQPLFANTRVLLGVALLLTGIFHLVFSVNRGRDAIESAGPRFILSAARAASGPREISGRFEGPNVDERAWVPSATAGQGYDRGVLGPDRPVISPALDAERTRETRELSWLAKAIEAVLEKQNGTCLRQDFVWTVDGVSCPPGFSHFRQQLSWRNHHSAFDRATAGVDISAEDCVNESIGILYPAAFVYGVCQEDVARWSRWLDRLAEMLRDDLVRHCSEGHVYLRRLLERLHGTALTGGYSREATNPVEVFATGRFNCVSASIVVLEVCRRLGWEAYAVEWPGHVACRVRLTGQSWLVDATVSPTVVRGSIVPWNEHCQPAMDENTVSQEAWLFPSRAARVLTDAELLGIVYFNRAIDLLAAGDYKSACRAQLMAVALDPNNHQARTNLAAILNNWAVREVRSHELAKAALLLQLAHAIAPEDPTVTHNGRWLTRWCASLNLESNASD